MLSRKHILKITPVKYHQLKEYHGVIDNESVAFVNIRNLQLPPNVRFNSKFVMFVNCDRIFAQRLIGSCSFPRVQTFIIGNCGDDLYKMMSSNVSNWPIRKIARVLMDTDDDIMVIE